MLSRDFYLRPAVAVAPELLGKRLVHKTPEGKTAGIIVEVEAYDGAADKGAHSYKNKRTPRTEIQFGPGGFAYVYAIYGLHSCFNVVVNWENRPEVVLVRALEPTDGLSLMRSRRGLEDPIGLCSGPGKLCQAMGITKAQYGADLCGSTLYIEEGIQVPLEKIAVSPRINIDYAQECREYPWRFFVSGNEHVSKVPKRYASSPFLGGCYFRAEDFAYERMR